MKVNIYVLIDPTTSKIRYIGRTTNSLNTRLVGHISKSKIGKTHKDFWIQKLLKSGHIPIIKLYTVIIGWKESHKYEQQLINKALKFGFILTNTDDRGEGCLNKQITNIQKLKISNTLKNKYISGVIKPTNTTKVYVFDLNGNLLNQFESCSMCCKTIGIPQSSLENVLSKRVKRWKGFQITYGELPGIYKIKVKDMSKLMKTVYVLDIIFNKTYEFKSFKEASKFLNVSSPTIRRYIESKLLYKNQYFISNARLKQGELLETPTLERQKEDNQQPSLGSNTLEGSTTNSRVLTGNAEDSNANTSALPKIITDKNSPLYGCSFSYQIINFSDDIV